MDFIMETKDLRHKRLEIHRHIILLYLCTLTRHPHLHPYFPSTHTTPSHLDSLIPQQHAKVPEWNPVFFT